MNTENSPLAAAQPASPTLIPLHNEYSSSEGALPEWAMIELNGELIAPPLNPQADKENPAQKSAEDSLVRKDHVELGSVRFVDNVSCVRTIPITLAIFAGLLTNLSFLNAS